MHIFVYFCYIYKYRKEIPELLYRPVWWGVVSHGAPFGGMRVFADHTRWNKYKQNASMIFARCEVFTCVFTSYAPDESQLFWSHEKPE